jgi:hypothetical protein
MEADRQDTITTLYALCHFPAYPIAFARLGTDQHDGYRRAIQLLPHLLPDISFVVTVDRIQKVPANELQINILIPTEQIEAFRLHPIVVLV